MGAVSSAEAPGAGPMSQAGLRVRIGRLCHLIRAAAVLWAGWTLLVTIRGWSDSAKLLTDVGHVFQVDLSGVADAQYISSFIIDLGSWTAVAAVSYCIWRLFGSYLQGRIFTVDAAVWMQRIGIAGIVAVLTALVDRRMVWLILTSHANLPLSTRLSVHLLVPNDLLEVLFCLFVIALARVFKVAAEMADDHARIV